MIRTGLLLSFLLFFASCMTIGFEQPQPAGKKARKAFPKALLGVYDDVPFGRDSELVILPTSVYVDGEDAFPEGRIELGKDLVLKKYKGYYFASYWDEAESCWLVHPFQAKGDQLRVFNLDPGKEQAAVLLSAHTPIVRQGNDLLVVDPDRKALLRMLKDPALWRIDTLYRWE